MNLMFIVFGIVIAIIIFLIISIMLFLQFAPTFGGKPDTESWERIKNSPNFDGSRFTNLVDTHASTVNIGMITDELTHRDDYHEQFPNADVNKGKGILKGFIFPPKDKNPNQLVTKPLQFNDPNGNVLKNGNFVWLGHSTVLFKTHGKTLITDPVFHRASPIPIGIPQFSMTNTPKAADLPYVDCVLLSHDHYDHLDHRAIKQMKNKVGHFYVPLGVKCHLVRWGVAKEKISEYDWYDEITIDGIRLVFAPARHFSGRGITNHRTTLWGSWIVQSPQLSVYFSGDGGYSPEFANIGKKFGNFDIAFIEDGAYNLRWQDVHMLPEQSAQAGIDVGAKVVLPIHWGKFDLSTHVWTDPIERIKSAMEKYNATVEDDKKVRITTPRIGQIFSLTNLPVDEWWL